MGELKVKPAELLEKVMSDELQQCFAYAAGYVEGDICERSKSKNSAIVEKSTKW